MDVISNYQNLSQSSISEQKKAAGSRNILKQFFPILERQKSLKSSWKMYVELKYVLRTFPDKNLVSLATS